MLTHLLKQKWPNGQGQNSPNSHTECIKLIALQHHWELHRIFQCFSDARMWTQCTPQKLDIVSAVSGSYLNNLAS